MILYKTYCSLHYLERLYSELKLPGEDDEGGYSKPEHLPQLSKLIHSHSELFLDIPEEEVIERSRNPHHPLFNPSLNRLLKGGRQYFTSIPKAFDQLKTEEDYFKGKTIELYFIDETDKFCYDILNNNGINCSNFSQFTIIEDEMFEISILKINKNAFFELWDSFRNICPASNALIIVDQFLIKEKESKTLNLFPLLESLLPSTLSFPYDLAIFISEESNQPIELLYKEIEVFLLKKFSYEVNLTILQTKKTNIHDRYILSNRFLIDSGHGFDLIRQKNGKSYFNKNTKISFFPITLLTRTPKKLNEINSESNALSDWKALIETYRGILKNTLRESGRIVNIKGSGTHRLLK